MSHVHYFGLTLAKVLFIIALLFGMFYAFNYIKEKYQIYQKEQAIQHHFEKKKNSQEKMKEKKSQEENEGLETKGRELLKEKKLQKRRTPSSKVCSVYSEWGACEE